MSYNPYRLYLSLHSSLNCALLALSVLCPSCFDIEIECKYSKASGNILLVNDQLEMRGRCKISR